MRRIHWFATLALAVAAHAAAAGQDTPIANPAIDVTAHLRVAAEAAQHRESRRVDEDTFIALARLPGTVILDARSRERYDELHVRGAVNLAFPDITAASLGALVPDKGTRILIYCNNNFANAGGPFPTKLPSASLNLSTFAALYDYGYRNVYELGPLLDAGTTRIAFAGSQAAAVRAR